MCAINESSLDQTAMAQPVGVLSAPGKHRNLFLMRRQRKLLFCNRSLQAKLYVKFMKYPSKKNHEYYIKYSQPNVSCVKQEKKKPNRAVKGFLYMYNPRVLDITLFLLPLF